MHLLDGVRVWRAQGDALQIEEIHVWLAFPFPGDEIAAAGDVFADLQDGEGGQSRFWPRSRPMTMAPGFSMVGLSCLVNDGWLMNGGLNPAAS